MSMLSAKMKKFFLSICIIGLSTSLFASPPAIWGSKHVIPYMPFGSAFSHSIQVTNDTSSSANIEIILHTNGSTYNANIAEVSPKTLGNITTAVISYIDELGLSSATVSITFIINNPDVQVSALYYARADADRVTIPVKKTYILENPSPESEL